MENFFIQKAEWVVVIGGILTLLGTILVNKKSDIESRRNEAKQDELMVKSLKLNNLLSGGDSFARLIPTESELNEIGFAINNDGDFPVYLKEIKIEDVVNNRKFINDPQNKIPKNFTVSISPYIARYPMDEIMPNNMEFIGKFPFAITEGAIFDITFFARNGIFYQRIIFSNAGDTLIHATQIKKRGSEIPIKTIIAEGFPDALINWN